MIFQPINGVRFAGLWTVLCNNMLWNINSIRQFPDENRRFDAMRARGTAKQLNILIYNRLCHFLYYIIHNNNKCTCSLASIRYCDSVYKINPMLMLRVRGYNKCYRKSYSIELLLYKCSCKILTYAARLQRREKWKFVGSRRKFARRIRWRNAAVKYEKFRSLQNVLLIL